MTIQNPIIFAGSTLSRAQVETIVAVLSSEVPPSGYYVQVDGEWGFYLQEPENEGQIAFVEAEDNRSVDMYVVINTDSLPAVTLEWRKITRTGTVTDPRTGKPKDPLFDFYSGLN